jgi:hypothetical protein
MENMAVHGFSLLSFNISSEQLNILYARNAAQSQSKLPLQRHCSHIVEETNGIYGRLSAFSDGRVVGNFSDRMRLEIVLHIQGTDAMHVFAFTRLKRCGLT